MYFYCNPPGASHPPPFLHRLINKAVTLLICISHFLNAPPNPAIFWPLTLCPRGLVSLSHIISLSSIHQHVLKRQCKAFFPRGDVATSERWATSLGLLRPSLPPHFPAATPPPPARPPPLHPRMTQNLPRRHHLAISQNHGTQWITVCAPSDTHVQAAVRGPKMTAPALGDRLNFSVHVCVHPQGSLCTCKCSYLYKYVWQYMWRLCE